MVGCTFGDSVTPDQVVSVLRSKGISASYKDGTLIYHDKEGVPIVYKVDGPLRRNIIHRIARKTEIDVHLFFRPDMVH